MRIRLDKLASEPFQWQETVVIDAAALESTEVVELGAIEWQGRIWQDSPGFRLEAVLAYDQTVSCDRCLTPLVQRVDTEVQLMVIQNAPQSIDDELELTAEDLEVTFVDGEELDADRLLLEQLQLNVPMRTLCREDCLGLCPECGCNLNIESCDCASNRVDPRWEALRGLQNSPDDGGH